jgi:soluble cytochrome b562
MTMRRSLAVAGAVVAACGLAVVAQPERGPGRGPAQTPEQVADRLMERDANADGKLSADELPGQFGAQLLATADSDGDGALVREEILVWARERPGRGGFGGVGPAGAPESVHECMEQAGRAARGLRGAEFGADTRERDLATVQGIQQALVLAKSMIDQIEMSPNAKAKFGTDEEAYKIAFRKQIVAALGESLSLESAILDGNAEAAKASAGQLIEARNAGHDIFQDEDE